MTRAARVCLLTIGALLIGYAVAAPGAGAAPAVQAPAAAAAPAAPPPGPMPTPPAVKVEPGYTSLFNGKDLSGWRVGGPVESFEVQNGAIRANGVKGPGHLFYDGPVRRHLFRNFDLRLDVATRIHSNGGVYVLTEYQESGFPGKGFEIQVNNSHTDRIRTGSLYHVVDLSYIPAKDDEWFSMEIQVKGQTITVWVKGTQALQWTQPADWSGAYDTPGRTINPGTIAFQAHDPNSYTYYANIRIKPLD
jgi:3-keto-disaccharide hydrolase